MLSVSLNELSLISWAEIEWGEETKGTELKELPLCPGKLSLLAKVTLAIYLLYWMV